MSSLRVTRVRDEKAWLHHLVLFPPVPLLVIYQICIYLSIYIWLPMHHFAIFNSFILTRALSGMFCITSDAVLKRRFIATENDGNVVSFPHLPPHSLDPGSILIWWSFRLSHGKDKMSRRIGGNWVCSETCRAQSCHLFSAAFFHNIQDFVGTREFTEYLTEIIWSSSMAFIIQELWQ